MKRFIKDWLVNFALIVLSVDGVFFIVNRSWGNISFNVELLFVTLLIRLLLILTGKFTSRYPILEYLLEFGTVTTVVLGIGWLLGWYNIDHMWLIIVIIAIVYTTGYVLNLTKANRDIAYINEQIKQRCKERAEQANEKQ